MTELDLPTAVDQVIRATQKRASTGIAPFFFIVGAGVSHPPIPLAAGIEQMCRKEIADQGLPPPPTGGSALDRYQDCFDKAFPQAEERRGFLHKHLHETLISPANFRLAHLLSEGNLTKLVFTPNFDEMLTRALRLFGHETIVCDHPKTTQRIDPRRSDLQVVHVHGTHWFYDCCNLRGEIEGQAQGDFADSTSMGQLLDRVLAERSPVVVGYSGWDGDVLMTAIRRRLQQPTLPFNLYWFCYRRSDLASLPKWLTVHASVRLVLPPKITVAEPETPDRLRRGPIEALGGEPEIEGNSGEPTLQARDVFEAFIQKLDLKAPHLTAEPLEFFLKHLQKNLDPEDASGRLFLIREVLDRIRVGMELERSKRIGGSAAEQQATKTLGLVRDAIRRSAYPAAAHIAGEIDFHLLDNEQRLELAEALEAAYRGLFLSDAEWGLKACEVWSNLAETALVGEGSDKKVWSNSAAKALNSKGNVLARYGRPDEAVVAFSQVIQRFGEEPAFRERVAVALLHQGFALRVPGKPEAAISEPQLREEVAKALLNQALTLRATGKLEAAIESYSQVVHRFCDDPAPVLRESAATALVYQGLAYEEMGKPDAANQAYSKVVQRFGDAPEPLIQELVAQALAKQTIVPKVEALAPTMA